MKKKNIMTIIVIMLLLITIKVDGAPQVLGDLKPSASGNATPKPSCSQNMSSQSL